MPTNLTNSLRASFAERAMTTYREAVGAPDEDNETILIDLLSDLLHYCTHHQLNFGSAVDAAYKHYVEELALEADAQQGDDQ